LLPDNCLKIPNDKELKAKIFQQKDEYYIYYSLICGYYSSVPDQLTGKKK
jgi:hypothetical protein